jgi:16S rRNA A1518/A1519 N6-dimethyltransferase RsmA/KsgA/DIM1 with predicted DNA glycosylase/AP lyase activity
VQGGLKGQEEEQEKENEKIILILRSILFMAFFQKPGKDQVFMRDEEIAEKIVALSGIGKNETVLEVGAGPGNLTKLLAKKAKKVITVEIDRSLENDLRKELKGLKNVEIIFGNALEVIENQRLRFDRIVSNPPYAICEPLIKILFRRSFRSAVLTLPWRFVERLTANPEERRFSKLTLFARSFFTTETLLRIPRTAWKPEPSTESMVIRLVPRKPAGRRDIVTRELALQDDKLLRNALREAFVRRGRMTKNRARETIDELKFPEGLLGKKISEMDLAELNEILGRIR